MRQKLLSQVLESKVLLPNSNSTPRQQGLDCLRCTCPSKHLCLPSKAAILILLWTAVIGTLYYVALGAAVFATDYNNQTAHNIISISLYDSIPYAISALVMIFYPLSGFIADVCCGRLKTIITSLCLLLTGLILVCLLEIVVLVSSIKNLSLHNLDLLSFLHSSLGIIVFILAAVSFVFFVIGLVGYQANFIQFGLDQLFEARSQYLGLFIHYAMWTFQLGAIPSAIHYFLYLCSRLKRSVLNTYLTIPLSLTVCLISLIFISYWKYHWFYASPEQSKH